jgi:predicted dehydrogenase
MGKTWRVMQVGLGSMGRTWLKVLQASPRVELAGAADLRPEALEKAVAEFGIAREKTSTDFKALLRKLKPEALVDATVPEAHLEVTLAAFRAKAHVLGEKPLADTLAHARRMVAAAKRSQRTYMVSQNRRWIPQVRAIREALAQGLLGALTTVNCDFYIGAHFGGFRAQMPHPLILDMSIHHFDMLRCMVQLDAEMVYCHEFNPKGSWCQGDAACSAVFEMQQGVVFTYRGSWCAEGNDTSWQGAWRFIGEQGTIVWDGDHAPVVELVTPAPGKFTYPRERKELPPLSTGPNHQAESLERFLNALEAGSQPESSCEENLPSLAMVFGAVESAKRKRRVKVAV